MRSRYRIHEHGHAHFVTATIVEWLPVFTTAVCCDIVVRSLDYSRQRKALKIYAWVILDTHLHAILSAPDLSAVLRELKSFTTSQIIEQLASEGRAWLLHPIRRRGACHPERSEGPHKQRPG